MGRRKKIAKIPKEDMPFMIDCGLCKRRILPEAPLEGLVIQIGPTLQAICADCGTQVALMMKIIQQRWG